MRARIAKFIAQWIREQPFFPLSIYTIAMFVILSPLRLHRLFSDIDPTGLSIYTYPLWISNPIVAFFNDFALAICFVAGLLAFLFAYRRLAHQREGRRRTIALAWAALVVTTGLIGILGTSIGTLNLLQPSTAMQLLSIAFSSASIGTMSLLRRWLERESRPASPNAT